MTAGRTHPTLLRSTHGGDEHAQVIDQAGNGIAGLYAVGNDAASVMGGTYPGGGITIGPAMTFGYIAGRHAAGVLALSNQTEPTIA